MLCAGGDISVEIVEGTDAVVSFYIIGNDDLIVEELTPYVQNITYKVSEDSTGTVELFTKTFPGEVLIVEDSVPINYRCQTIEVIQITVLAADIQGFNPGTYYQECQITDINGFTTSVFQENNFKIIQSSIT